jgi:hypothetical protein
MRYMAVSRESLIRDVMSLFPQLDRTLAQLVVDLHLRSTEQHGEDYDASQVAENLISAYRNETSSQRLPDNHETDEPNG